MNRKPRSRLIMVWPVLLCAALLPAQVKAAPNNPSLDLNHEFQSAQAQFQAGHLPEAATQLERLLPHAPKSFEIHELLGLVYVAQSLDEKALLHLDLAVRLKPDSAAARTNLAATLSHLGRLESAGEQFRRALELEPRAYDTNHNLGEFYIEAGKIVDAIPLLEQAQRINPSSYDNGYDLGLAYFQTGKLVQARQLVTGLMQQKDTAELHNLLGRIQEKDGDFVSAEKEYEIAAHMEPNEGNLFDWGSELLLHRTYDPAIDVFEQATQRYPKSPRLRIGLGMSLYSRGKYDEAVKALLAAADLDPSDPRCYLFLSKAYNSSPTQAEDVIQRFKRYSELQPRSGLALYYYAISLWKGKRFEDAGLDLREIEALLQKSIALDGTLADAYVQLGNLYADQHMYAKSIPEFVRALELDFNLPDAHYRLGQDYVHVGQKDRATQEVEIYQRLRAQHMAELDKERAEVKQFIYAEKSGVDKAGPSAKP